MKKRLCVTLIDGKKLRGRKSRTTMVAARTLLSASELDAAHGELLSAREDTAG